MFVPKPTETATQKLQSPKTTSNNEALFPAYNRFVSSSQENPATCKTNQQKGDRGKVGNPVDSLRTQKTRAS
jgi:hypothetical protein